MIDEAPCSYAPPQAEREEPADRDIADRCSARPGYFKTIGHNGTRGVIKIGIESAHWE